MRTWKAGTDNQWQYEDDILANLLSKQRERMVEMDDIRKSREE